MIRKGGTSTRFYHAASLITSSFFHQNTYGLKSLSCQLLAKADGSSANWREISKTAAMQLALHYSATSFNQDQSTVCVWVEGWGLTVQA